MDTHLIWGASYLVNDVYRRFMVRGGTEQHYVAASRVAVLVLVLVAAFTAWQMESIERGWIYVPGLSETARICSAISAGPPSWYRTIPARISVPSMPVTNWSKSVTTTPQRPEATV